MHSVPLSYGTSKLLQVYLRCGAQIIYISLQLGKMYLTQSLSYSKVLSISSHLLNSAPEVLRRPILGASFVHPGDGMADHVLGLPLSSITSDGTCQRNLWNSSLRGKSLVPTSFTFQGLQSPLFMFTPWNTEPHTPQCLEPVTAPHRPPGSACLPAGGAAV